MFNERKKSFYHARHALVLLLALVIGVAALQAQTKQIFSWQEDLNFLQNASDEELIVNRPAVVQIRRGVDLWIKLHPGTTISLDPAPPEPWGVEDIRNQVASLRQAVGAIVKEDPDQPFNLGVTTISVTAEASPLSPMADSIKRTEIQNLQAVTVASALDYLPGLNLDRGANRNEVGVRLRGFSNVGQIPLYLDGIPIQVPYDGTLDFNRFLTGSIAEIQVARGYSSPLMGANNLGGSINLVTRQPERKFESDAVLGTGSGDQLLAGLQLGSRMEKFYVQGSVDWLQRHYFPLSGDFPLQNPASPSPGYQTTYERNQSYSKDAKYSGRIAYTPRGQDQYVFSFINQKGEKGNPLYAGENLNARSRYWKWPYWNKTGYYFITNTGLGESSSLKFRFYYDQFQNGLSAYDSDYYNSMMTRRSFYSVYDDHSGGGTAEFTTRIVPRNTFSASFTLKDDTHKEYSYYARNSYTTPTTLDRLQTFSIGFQDVITITSRLRATFGFSADYLRGLQVQDLNDDEDEIIPIQCLSDPNNTSLSGCTPHIWTYNPQASVSYSFTNQDTLFVTFADRGRFPIMKEMYTTAFGSRLPNPELRPEHSRNWNIGYSHAFSGRTIAQIEYFHNNLRDAINDVYVIDPGSQCPESDLDGFCEQWANVAEEVHQGVEMSIRSTPISRLTLDVNYSYLNRNIDYASDIELIDPRFMILRTLPKNKVIFNAFFELPRNILILGTYRYEGGINVQDQTYNDPPPEYSTSYGTVDLGGVIPVCKGWSMQVGVKNLFDRYYYYTPGYPEIGRNWYLNSRFRF